jgi:hypothetical protein
MNQRITVRYEGRVQGVGFRYTAVSLAQNLDLTGWVKNEFDGSVSLVAEGADIIDVGGESTRPGAAPVAADEEIRRVMPIVEALAGGSVPVSVDTSKPVVMAAVIAAGLAGGAICLAGSLLTTIGRKELGRLRGLLVRAARG